MTDHLDDQERAANLHERELAQAERELQVDERKRVGDREDWVKVRLDVLDKGMDKMSASIDRLAGLMEENNKTTTKALGAVSDIAHSTSMRVGFFAKWIVPLIFAILLTFTGYLGLSARDRANTVCASVNQARADTVALLEIFKPLANDATRPLFDTAIAQRKQPAC